MGAVFDVIRGTSAVVLGFPYAGAQVPAAKADPLRPHLKTILQRLERTASGLKRREEQKHDQSPS